MNGGSTNRRVSAWMLTACGVWLVGPGLYFIALRPPLLPEDERFMGTTLAEIRTAVPGLENWLKRVLKGTSWAVAVSGALTVALMSATNFALSSDFKWVLLVPALVWLAGLAFYIAEQ